MNEPENLNLKKIIDDVEYDVHVIDRRIAGYTNVNEPTKIYDVNLDLVGKRLPNLTITTTENEETGIVSVYTFLKQYTDQSQWQPIHNFHM